MTEEKPGELSADASGVLAAKVREELARRRMSRQALADLARISLSTLEKALNGSRPFTLATVVRIEAVLGMPLRPAASSQGNGHATGAAPVTLGAYTADGVRWLEGDYLTLRPSLEIAGAIYAYRIVIEWDETAGCLAFRESARQDAPFTQQGVVSVPNKSGHIYLHTNDDGQFRLAMLGRPLKGGEMYGLLATLQAGSGTQLLPVAVPLALIPLTATPGLLGRIGPEAEVHAEYRAHLTRVTEGGFARLLLP